ncbi:MAG: (d)CMP kinase [Pseudomonadota bacterium]
MIVAIDGEAASGKGTIARRIAARFGLAYMDTGALYRAVARDLLAAGLPLDNDTRAVAFAERLDVSTLDDPALRERGVGEAASIVAAISSVRAALLARQRAFARQQPGAVLDGRDIGTVVCPDADVKIFVVADSTVRARRRYLELKSRGEPVSELEVLENIRSRDARDRNRPDSPMVPADDAMLLNTTNLDIDAAVAEAVRMVERSTSQPGYEA